MQIVLDGQKLSEVRVRELLFNIMEKLLVNSQQQLLESEQS